MEFWFLSITFLSLYESGWNFQGTFKLCKNSNLEHLTLFDGKLNFLKFFSENVKNRLFRSYFSLELFRQAIVHQVVLRVLEMYGHTRSQNVTTAGRMPSYKATKTCSKIKIPYTYGRYCMPVVGKQDIIDCYHKLNVYSKAEVSCLLLCEQAENIMEDRRETQCENQRSLEKVRKFSPVPLYWQYAGEDLTLIPAATSNATEMHSSFCSAWVNKWKMKWKRQKKPLYDRTHRKRQRGMKVTLYVPSFMPAFSMRQKSKKVTGLPAHRLPARLTLSPPLILIKESP